LRRRVAAAGSQASETHRDTTNNSSGISTVVIGATVVGVAVVVVGAAVVVGATVVVAATVVVGTTEAVVVGA